MRKSWILALAMSGVLAGAVTAHAQKQKNNPVPIPPLPVSQQINHDIGEMLGAWQVGDVEAMHKYYADDATWVAGTFDPPIKGWQNYAAAYQRQRQRISSPQLIHRNVNIFHYGDIAWACYQWEFSALVDGRPSTSRGQTTLVLVKTGDRWLIVHNHTSEICPLGTPETSPPRQPGN